MSVNHSLFQTGEWMMDLVEYYSFPHVPFLCQKQSWFSALSVQPCRGRTLKSNISHNFFRWDTNTSTFTVTLNKSNLIVTIFLTNV